MIYTDLLLPCSETCPYFQKIRFFYIQSKDCSSSDVRHVPELMLDLLLPYSETCPCTVVRLDPT